MDTDKLISELLFKTSRSAGAGGQHVNKVESKVTLSWNVQNSQALQEVEKQLILEKLKNRISNERLLQLESSETRSQIKNKKIAIERFLEIIKTATTPVKSRKNTKIPASVNAKRLEQKRLNSLKKIQRKKYDF